MRIVGGTPPHLCSLMKNAREKVLKRTFRTWIEKCTNSQLQMGESGPKEVGPAL